MSKIKIISIVAVAAILIAGAAYWNISRAQNAQGLSDMGMPVMVETAYRDTIISEITAKGEVALLNTELVYTDTEATVAEVLVEKNETVVKGQVLIRYSLKDKENLQEELETARLNLRHAQLSLDSAKLPPVTDAEIKAAQLDITSAEQAITDVQFEKSQQEEAIRNKRIDLADAQDTYETKTRLYESGVITKTDWEDAEKRVRDLQTEITTAENDLKPYDDKLKMAEQNLDYAKVKYDDLLARSSEKERENNIAQLQIRVDEARLQVNSLQKKINEFQSEIVSPIDGTVVDINVSEGEVTLTEKSLMEIADLDKYVVKVNIKERNAPSISIGQPVTISGNALGKVTCTGRITKIEPIAIEIQSSNGTEKVVPIEITMDADAPLLKPGYSMEATIVTDRAENTVVVPIMATMSDRDGSQYVWIAKDDNTLEKRIVELGAFSDLTVAVTGVSEGEQVLSQPTGDLMEGMSVMPMNPYMTDEMPEDGEIESEEESQDGSGETDDTGE